METVTPFFDAALAYLQVGAARLTEVVTSLEPHALSIQIGAAAVTVLAFLIASVMAGRAMKSARELRRARRALEGALSEAGFLAAELREARAREAGRTSRLARGAATPASARPAISSAKPRLEPTFPDEPARRTRKAKPAATPAPRFRPNPAIAAAPGLRNRPRKVAKRSAARRVMNEAAVRSLR